MANQINVAVVIYDLVELVDMNGPIDVFIHANVYDIKKKYNVYTVAADMNPIQSEGNNVVKLLPTYSIKKCPVPDIVVIPGTHTNDGSTPLASPAVINWIGKMGREGKLIMSVCVGAFNLAKTGLLDGRKATTHWLSFNDLHKLYPKVLLVPNVRYVQDENFITTGGVTSGIDGALYVVEQNDGIQVAQDVAGLLVYERNAPIPPNTLLTQVFNSK